MWQEAGEVGLSCDGWDAKKLVVAKHGRACRCRDTSFPKHFSIFSLGRRSSILEACQCRPASSYGLNLEDYMGAVS